MMSERKRPDYYRMLGVRPDATSEEIRRAYRKRAKTVHPDRFDRNAEPEKWQQAHRRMVILNRAYEVLTDEQKRAAYDRRRVHEKPVANDEPVILPAAGEADFADLPANAQAAMLKRQSGTSGEIRMQMDDPFRWFAAIAVTICWFVYLAWTTNDERWGGLGLSIAYGLSALLGAVCGHSVLRLAAWNRLSLDACFYVTPLYFIETDFDRVSWRPLWELKDLSVMYKYESGSYQHFLVTLSFGDKSRSFTLKSKRGVRECIETIGQHQQRLAQAVMQDDVQFLMAHNDFAGVIPNSVPKSPPGPKTKAVAIAAALAAMGLTLVADVANRSFANRPSVRHEYVGVGASRSPGSPQRSVRLNDDIFRTRDIAHDPVILPRPNSASEDAAVENLTPLETPTTGMTVRFHSTAAVAPLQIVTRNSGVNYLVKIEDWESEATALTVFVRGGETASVDIPVGLYRIKYAAGRTWYGLEFLFGQGTDYFVAESQFRFEVVGNEVRGYTIELYLQKDGNLSTKKIDPEKW